MNANPPRIRVLLVDDSALALELLRRMLATAPDMDVVGTASSGQEALQRVLELQPQVVCTDYHMPGMNGLELTREIMARAPRPVLVISDSLQPDQRDNIFSMLEAGALDVLAKPQGSQDMHYAAMAAELLQKIRVLSGVRVFRRWPLSTPVATASVVDEPLVPQRGPRRAVRVVGLGASTGGPQALERVLRALPRNWPVPVLCVQHIAPGFVNGLATWLGKCCALPVCIAQTGQTPEPGVVYLAADGLHLDLDAQGRMLLSDAAPVSGHRPSVNVLFEALARHYGDAAAGVLLTGMGRDGAQGLLALHRAGGYTIAQDEASSVVYGMPGHARDLGAADAVLPLDQIGPVLRNLLGEKTR